MSTQVLWDLGESAMMPLAPQASDCEAFPSPAYEALRSVAWLRDVSPRALEALAAEAMLHRVPPGSLVFEQAETPAFAQFLLAGSVELLGVRGQTEALIELLQPVDLIIPAAVVTGQPYLMRARVYEEAHLLLVSAETFRHAMATDHAFCRAILGCLAAQFRRQVRTAKNLRLRSAEERVGCYLVALLHRNGDVAPLRLPIDKQEIAAQLGMSREVLSRALSGMDKFGMRIVGKTLEVDDAEAAKSRFPFDPFIDGVEPIAPAPAKRTRS
jgi:CRP/FNR family transcriptional regulator, transcriptional activator FtrB